MKQQQIPIDKFLESNAYQQAKQVLFDETNQRQVPKFFNGSWYAPISRTPSFNRVESVDYGAFKQSKGEKDLIKEYKKDLPKSRSHKFVVFLKASF